MKPANKKDRWLASMVSKMDNAKADEMDDKVDDEMHLYDMIRNMSNNNMFNNNGEPVNDPFSQVRFRPVLACLSSNAFVISQICIYLSIQ